MGTVSPRPIRIATISPVAADADGLATSQTPGAAGNLTLAATTLDIPRHVTITSAGNDSARTFTVTGTDRYGNTVTEAITGPNTTTVSGAVNFSTITTIAVDDATAGAITAGWGTSFDTAWIVRDRQCEHATIAGELTDSPAMSCTVEHTWTDVQAEGTTDATPVAIQDWALNGKIASFYGNLPMAVAHRVAVTAFTAGDLAVTVIQAG